MKKIIKWGLIGFGGLIILGVLLGDDSDEATKVGESGDQPAQEEETTQEEFKVGDKISFEGRVLTVNSVKRNYVEPSPYSFTPEQGKEFILVNVTLENKGENTIDFGSYDFQLEDSNGVQRDTAYVGAVKNELNYGDLSSGGKVTGNIPFEVKKGGKGLRLIFNPSFWSDKEVVVKL